MPKCIIILEDLSGGRLSVEAKFFPKKSGFTPHSVAHCVGGAYAASLRTAPKDDEVSQDDPE